MGVYVGEMKGDGQSSLTWLGGLAQVRCDTAQARFIG
jgi:hypothetical protein